MKIFKKIKMKKALIIYHRSDFDGVGSACIIKRALIPNFGDNIELLGYNYNDELPNFENIVKTIDLIVIADLSFDSVIMERLFVEAREKVIWIDHHETAIKASIGKYDLMRGVRTITKAAIELCWEFFNPSIPTPLIIKYLGAYDIWDRKTFNWDNDVHPLQKALKAEYGVSVNKLFPDFENLIQMTDLKPITGPGKLIIKYINGFWKNAVNNYSFEITVAGKYLGIALMTTEFSSTIFDSIPKGAYQIMCVVNKRDEEGYGMSLYVEPDTLPEFSAGEYLKEMYGGGGHKGAAGCLLNFEQFSKLVELKQI